LKNILAMRRQKNRAMLLSELARIQLELKVLGAKKIIIFGSSARDEAGLDSDLDLIVVMDSDDDFVDRVGALYKKIKPRAAVDFFVYTPAEFEKMSKDSMFLKNVLREAKTLYEAEC